MKHLKTINELFKMPFSKNNSKINNEIKIGSDEWMESLNQKVKKVLSEIQEKNVNLTEFEEVKNVILNEDFDKASAETKYTHRTAKVQTPNGIVTFGRFYVNNYGDSSSIDGITSYYIECPGYDNSDDVSKLKTVLGKADITNAIQSLEKRSNDMLITSSEFEKLWEKVSSWVKEKEKEHGTKPNWML